MERRKGKPIWKSKTLWLNALLAMGVVAEANLGVIREWLGPQSYYGLTILAAGLNAGLRFVTSQPLEK